MMGSYSCGKCDFVAADSRGFSWHQAFNHMFSSQFVCHKCEKTFAHQEQVIMHILEQHLGQHFNSKMDHAVAAAAAGQAQAARANVKIEAARTVTIAAAAAAQQNVNATAALQVQNPAAAASEEHVTPIINYSSQNLFPHNLQMMTQSPQFPAVNPMSMSAPTLTTTPLFQCSYCSQTFAHPGQRQEHVETMHKVNPGGGKAKPFTCDICKKTFAQHENLQAHRERIHFNERKVSCPLCDKEFGDRATAKRHERMVHLKQKNFRCSRCEYTCFFKMDMSRHVKRVHPDMADNGTVVLQQAGNPGAAGAQSDQHQQAQQT